MSGLETEIVAEKLPRATHHGVWEAHGIDCYVLDDGRRVMSQRAILRCITGGADTGNLTRYLGSAAKNPLGQNLLGFTAVSKGGVKMAVREAKDVALIAQYFVSGAIDGTLRADQKHLADGALRLLTGLAGIAIDALIDEVTGYQYDRPTDALQREYEKLLRPDPCDWDLMWDPVTVLGMCKLRGIEWDGKGRYPQWTSWTMHQIYCAVFGDHLVAEWHRISPDPNVSDKRRHQYLTDPMRDVFRRKHLDTVRTIMGLSRDERDFLNKLRHNYGRAPLQLAFGA